MNLGRFSPRGLFRRLWPEGLEALQIQLLLLFVLSTLLDLGFPGVREWRRVAEEDHVQTLMRGWDGLAWYIWLAAAPFMLVLIRRHPISRERITRSIGPLLRGSLALYLVVTHLRYLLRVLPHLWHGGQLGQFFTAETYAYNTFGLLPLDLLTYCGFFAVSLSVEFYFEQRRQQERTGQLQLRAVRLQSDLVRAELSALRNQLHPHFLFNSFNAVAALIRLRKNETAIEVIAKLSALLRLAIDRAGLQEIPLEQEMDFIRRYLEIEQLRFGEKLLVEYTLDPATLPALVPNILLQPLVENAIKHGISLRTTPGHVRIISTRAGGRLTIEIRDDGLEDPVPPGCGERGEQNGPGIGLKNARAQLVQLYADDYRLELHKAPGEPTVVRLDLPFRLTPAC